MGGCPHPGGWIQNSKVNSRTAGGDGISSFHILGWVEFRDQVRE